jgi:membrane associated rhomboid family serine protease
MLLFPVRTDRPLRSTPAMNYALIAANIVVFLLTTGQITAADAYQDSLREAGKFASWSQIVSQFPVTGYYLHPREPRLVQFFTSMFLHADFWHLLGNMVFLYVFGNSVEDRLGKIGYLLFYLAGGIVAALGHVSVESGPILGASGAVNAVTGAYLALFPLSKITVLFFLFIIGFLEIPSIWLIGVRFVQDAIQFLGRAGGVAYLAHLSGSVYGFLLGMILLWTRVLPREPYDMMSLLEHRKRRAEFRRLTRRGFQPWEGRAGEAPTTAGGPGMPGGPIAPLKPLTAAEARIMEKRAEITRALGSRNHDRAAELYAELLDLDANQLLNQQQQLDLANHVASMGRYDLAARMYELYLNNYKSTGDREEIELMLALLYIRYLKRGQRARELLAAAMPKLHGEEQKAMARGLLQQLEGA